MERRVVPRTPIAIGLVAAAVLATPVPAPRAQGAGPALTLVSVSSSGVKGSADSLMAAVSADGRFVVFDSRADNLVANDSNQAFDVFVRDLTAGTTTRVSVGPGGVQGSGHSRSNGSISGDGRYVAYWSVASNLVPGDTNGYTDVFVYDRATASTVRASVATNGAQANGDSQFPVISADGRYVAFVSKADNLVPGDTNGADDVFVRDLVAQTTSRVSLTAEQGQGNGASGTVGVVFSRLSISASGRYVAFASAATNLIPGVVSPAFGCYIRDRAGTGTTVKVDVPASGGVANGWCGDPVTSADGRYVAFVSKADNLVAGDVNAGFEVFVRDRVANTTVLVSVSTAGAPGDRESAYPSISADGRFVTFTSWSTNFTIGGTNNWPNAFVRDLLAGTTTLLSVTPDGSPGNRGGQYPALSADGRTVVFDSPSSNLVSGDADFNSDVYLTTLERYAPRPMRASVATGGQQGAAQSIAPALSADGRFVVFASAADNLVWDDANGLWDVFQYDRATGTTTRVSVASDGTPPNDHSERNAFGAAAPAISADGRYTAFSSAASNLVDGDGNGRVDVFVHDRLRRTTVRASVASDGTEGNGDSDHAVLSADGRYVAFRSWASNLVANDSNNLSDIFVRDLVSGTTTRVSVSSVGTQGTRDADAPSISSDGRYVVFETASATMVPGDTNGVSDIFVHDRNAATTIRASVTSGGGQANGASTAARISGDGSFVIFASVATNLVAGDTNGRSDVFVYFRLDGAVDRVSLAPDGSQMTGDSRHPSISGDGAFVAFDTLDYVMLGGDLIAVTNCYARDYLRGPTILVSVPPGGGTANGSSSLPAISANTRLIAFQSGATNLVSGDTNGVVDIFVTDRSTVTWPAPAAITYGTPLGPSQLNASAAVPGTFVYTPPAGTVLPAGPGQVLTATFTPTDPTYNGASTRTVTIDVLRAVPALSWAAPAAVTAGTPLTRLHLNATTTVAGVFVYAPPAGTVLPVGTHALSVTFTPADLANYEPASAGTTIQVVSGGTAFTDPDLTPGVTPIRAVHVTELRTRIDAVRVRLGLSPFAWTDPVVTAGVTPLKAAHLADLRTALGEAYTAAGRPQPVYTDPILTAGGSTATTLHILELRAALTAIE